MKPIHATWTLILTLIASVAWAQGAGPTDPQIAAIVVTANQVDIDAGKLALEGRTTRRSKPSRSAWSRTTAA